MEKNEKGIDIISFEKPKNITKNKKTKKSTKKNTKKQNNLWKKIKKWLAALVIGTAATSLAISAGEGTKTNETEIEKPIEKPNGGKATFKEKLKVKTNEEITKEIEGLETSEDVLAYLKNLYIEEYENKTGDTSLTTEDIEIRFEDTQNYAYIINGETEEIVLHGKNPYETENKLKEQGKEYYTADNLGTIIIVTNNDKCIDGAGTLNNKNEVYNVVEPEGKSLGIIKDNWGKYATLGDLWKTFKDPTNNKYMEGLAKENVINAITNEINNTNKVESVESKEIDEGR